MSLTSKDYLKQIAKSKGVCPLTNEVKDNALLFPVGFKNIYKDLDRLEKLENQVSNTIDYILNEALGVSAESYADLQNENQKLKNALEIIKEKNVDIALVTTVSSVEQYNQIYVYDYMLDVKWCLIQEEYELLKEVLNNE